MQTLRSTYSMESVDINLSKETLEEVCHQNRERRCCHVATTAEREGDRETDRS